MCHDHDSRPPAPPRTGEVGERGTLTLTAADGNSFSAAYAAPAGPARAGVVVLPDIRGLHPYYVALTERFAEAGLPAVALDWFGRTAGVAETGTREEDFDWQSHIPQTKPESIDADIAAAITYLRGRTRADLPVITVGFCFGGSHSWRQAGGDLDLAACAGFYGRPAMVGEVAEVEPRLDAAELDRLIAQANRQYEWLTHTRRDVAAGVFGGRPAAAEVADR